MKFLLILFLVVFFYVSTFSQEKDTTNSYANIFNDFAKHEDFNNASIGLIALDFETGKILAEKNSNLSLIPASTLKLVTTATALEILGAKTQFETKLYYEGQIDSNKVLHGNIIIKGGGDPALGSELFKEIYNSPYFFTQWATKIKELGIDSINGNIVGDGSYFNNVDVPSTWIWGDMGNYYGAFASGLTIFENTYKIIFAPEDSVGASAKISGIEPEISDLDIQNDVVISKINKDLAYVYGAPYQNERIIKGTIPKHNKEFIVKGSIPNPSAVAASELKSELEKLGVNISNNIQNAFIDSLIFITSLKSPMVEDIVKITNLKSHNLFAEHLALQVGKTFNINVTYDIATDAITDFWNKKGINTKGMYLNDGCGLSRYNAITSKQLAGILFYMKNSNNFDSYYNSLPVLGESGTLAGMNKNEIAQGKVHAKSGYLTRARNYAGYLTTITDKKIIFVIMMNNYSCSASDSKKHAEDLFNKMVNVKL